MTGKPEEWVREPPRCRPDVSVPPRRMASASSCSAFLDSSTPVAVATVKDVAEAETMGDSDAVAVLTLTLERQGRRAGLRERTAPAEQAAEAQEKNCDERKHTHPR